MSQLRLHARNLLFALVLGALVLTGCTPAPTVAAPTAAATQPPAAEATATTATTGGEATAAPTEAGSALTPDRLVPEITFVFSTADDDPARNEVGKMLTNEWTKLGLRVNPVQMTYDTMIDLYSTEEGYNAFTLGYDGRPERLDPEVLIRRLYYPGLNFMGYDNPEVTRLIDEQTVEMDPAKRRDLVFQIQEIVAQDLPAIIVYHDSSIDVYNNELWENVRVMPGQGVYNYWTLLDATPKGDQKVLRVAHNELPVNLNPFFETTGADTEVMRELYDTLARVGLDGLPTPGAAESWEVVDPTTINMTIRQGMIFNDGTPVTAADVKYSYDIQKEEGSSIYKPFLASIDSIDLVDDYHLVFHLTTPNAAIFMATFSQIYIIPEHIWSQVSGPKADYDNNTAPVGSGPYNLEEWRPNEEIRMSANKSYQFPVNPDGYSVILYSNLDAVFQALVDQEADINYDPLTPVQVEIARGIPYLTVTESQSHQIRIVGFNVRFPPFDDPKFRDAIGYTVDFDTIVNVILGGAGIEGSGVISPVNTYWHDPNQLFRRYDPAKARELLAAAGYEWDDQGLMYMPAK
ncbi:MAG: hypothetical protein IT317_07320 [Anaerolineales bacterium]|nr:hypothetical protein [Anaerolineales bacterium]